MSEEGLTIYRGCTPVVDARYGSDSDRTPAEAIVNAIATAADVDALDLPPLYEVIDLEALDRLFDDHDGERDSDVLFSFTVDRWNVFVRGDGRIRVCDGTRPTSPEPVFESTTA